MIYRYRATIAGNKIFLREYEIRKNTTLYSLHLFLQDDLGFAPDQCVMFRGLSAENKIKKEYGLFDLGDGTMDSVMLEDIYAIGLPIIEYVYDMFNERTIRMEFLSEREELERRRSYPRLIVEKGRNPNQFSDGYNDLEQMIETNYNHSIEENESDFPDE